METRDVLRNWTKRRREGMCLHVREWTGSPDRNAGCSVLMDDHYRKGNICGCLPTRRRKAVSSRRS